MKSNKSILSIQKLLLVFFLINCGLSGYAQTTKDYVILKSGDVVSGKITQLNDTAVFITSEVLGDFVLKRSDIQSISLNASYNPQLGNITTKLPRPNYEMPLWYKTIGVGFNSLGINAELGRRIESTRLNTFVKSGVQILPNYGISTVPVEIGFGIYHDTSKRSDFLQFHGGYSFLLTRDNWIWYEPGPVYGFDYRHVFVNRYNPKLGSYIEVGFEGGILKRELDNWWSPGITERVVHRNRLRVGFGFVF